MWRSGMAEKRDMMRETRSMSSSLLLCLLTWRCCDGVKAGAYGAGVVAGRRCASDYVTVADTTSFPVAGCYRRTMNHDHDHGSGFSYANYAGKVYEGTASQPMVLWKVHDDVDESPWGIGIGIGENGEPPSTMCTSRSETGVEGWECNDGAIFEELVTCGCSTSDQQAADRYHTAWVQAQGGSVSEGGGVIWGDGGGGRRKRMRGAGSRDRGMPLVAGASGGAGVSRVLASGEFHSFWMWVIIVCGIVGLIMLCCIGWYIRNPFFCQKAPPADPNAQVEDAAPQAPKTAFQPWGASAPPK